MIAYYEDVNENWHGPVKAITNLPTTAQWTNVSLASDIRAILTETGTTSTPGGTLPTDFSYSGYAARLLTTQEISSACGITVGSLTANELETCDYLMENTKYSNDSLETYGYWLESSDPSHSTGAWNVYGAYCYISNDFHVSRTNYLGSRPAIEILKSDIEI